ncbi:hypothetical protein SKAU_G00020640 [Synaphobranchus kaupii]|uniref:Uncharacterized protein n=1 Tax=Synaphobranchus kaupii TaxID=118154 RepID=A0A9Q1GBQ8_SYNKA|nr:hypothetical protein SKAU_G00020640 [Synaphobranchus kaupii]
MAGTDQDVERLIKLRGEKDSLFSGRRNAAQQGWDKRQELTDIPQPLLPRQCIPVLLHNHLRVGRRPERDLQLQ